MVNQTVYKGWRWQLENWAKSPPRKSSTESPASPVLYLTPQPSSCLNLGKRVTDQQSWFVWEWGVSWAKSCLARLTSTHIRAMSFYTSVSPCTLSHCSHSHPRAWQVLSSAQIHPPSCASVRGSETFFVHWDKASSPNPGILPVSSRYSFHKYLYQLAMAV